MHFKRIIRLEKVKDIYIYIYIYIYKERGREWGEEQGKGGLDLSTLPKELAIAIPVMQSSSNELST